MKTVIADVLFINYMNLNKRIYTKNTCQKIIDDFNKQNSVFGEIEPDNTDISLANVSHLVEKLWIENNILKAEIKILNTPQGKILEQLVDSMCFSSRAFGTINPDNTVEIKKFLTIDAIYSDKDPYKICRLRKKKLERILNEK